MKQVYTFHETARGYIHIIKEIPCEDYSDSFSEENGRYHIAVVADGHGSEECFRSAFGSRTAVKTAMECLKEFADSYLLSEADENELYINLLSKPREKQRIIKQLTDTIVSKWIERVCADYEEHPPEKDEIGDYSDKYADGKNIPHIYGTTLIAALLLPKCMILIQQGDGRCNVFYEDGTADQPIPWDENCEDNITSSMCDSDAAIKIRSTVLDTVESKVTACYLGTDGVEDAYLDTYTSKDANKYPMHCIMGGVYTFYKDLSCQMASLSKDEFEKYLKDMLPEFSEKGRFGRSFSGDDVSVAGIADVDALQSLKEQFLLDVERYELEERLFWKEDDLRSKKRKHSILEERFSEAQHEVSSINSEIEKLKSDLAEFKCKHDDKQSQSGTQNKEIHSYDMVIQDLEQELKQKLGKLSESEQRLSEAEKTFSEYDAKYQADNSEIVKLTAEIKNLDQKIMQKSESLYESVRFSSEARKTFKWYDAKYQADSSEIEVLTTENMDVSSHFIDDNIEKINNVKED